MEAHFGFVKLPKCFDTGAKAPMMEGTSLHCSPVLGCADSPGVWLTALRFSCRWFWTRRRPRGRVHPNILFFICKEATRSKRRSLFYFPG